LTTSGFFDRVPDVVLAGRATADPGRDGPLMPDLVTRARAGDKQAWDALVERYAPLIWSICWKYRLGHADAQDVGQSVWLGLVDQLDKIRDPAKLPGWLAITTRRECGRVLGTARRLRAPVYALDVENLPDGQADPPDGKLLTAERHAALREAFSRLPPDGQQMMAMLISDPPVPYADISARLGTPSAASARNAAATWTSYAVIRPSPRSSTPPTADMTLRSPAGHDNHTILTGERGNTVR
jgi:RNA polymerase sigma factor (sigma-70 family)